MFDQERRPFRAIMMALASFIFMTSLCLQLWQMSQPELVVRVGPAIATGALAFACYVLAFEESPQKQEGGE